MGNCATKPKVLKDSKKDLVPDDPDPTVPAHHNKVQAEKQEKPTEEDEVAAAAAAARRSEKGKDILIEDDVEKHSKRHSLSNLFHEDKSHKTVELGAEVTREFPQPKTNSSDILKIYTPPMDASNVKAPETRNDLEVKIPKDSPVKTPETPKANEAKEQEKANFSENWEVKFPEELEAKNLKKTSDCESKLPEVKEVSAPELSEVKIPKKSDVPESLEDKNIPEVSKVKSDEGLAPGLSEIKVTKESSVPEDLEDKTTPEVSSARSDEASVPELFELEVTKELSIPLVLEDRNTPEVSKVRSDEVKFAEAELLKVSEVKSSEDLEIKVPKVFEVKTPESEIKTDQVESNVKTLEETEFVDAQEKIEKLEQTQIHKGINVAKNEEIVLQKQEENGKDSTLSDLGNK